MAKLIKLIDKYVLTPVAYRFSSDQTKHLLDRRGGYLSHRKLAKVFKEIGQDKYVRLTREKLDGK